MAKKMAFEDLTDEEKSEVQMIADHEKVSIDEAMAIYARAQEMDYDDEAFENALASDLVEADDFEEPDTSDTEAFVGIDTTKM